MAFERGFDDSDELLRGILQSLYLSPSWVEVRNYVGMSLKTFVPIELRKGLAPQLAQQLILDIVGREIRELWRLQHAFDETLLREPYLPTKRRADLTKSITKQLHRRIDILLQEGTGKTKLDEFVFESNRILETLISFKRAGVLDKAREVAELNRISPGLKQAPEAFQDTIGKALVQTLRKTDFVIRLMSNIGAAPALDKNGQVLGAAGKARDNTTTSMEAVLNGVDTEVAEITEGLSVEAVKDISKRLRGTLLSVPLRGTLWGFGFLTRNFTETPNGSSNMRELARLAQIKGYKIGDHTSSPIADLVSRSVANGIQTAMRTTLASPSEKAVSIIGTLAKRSEILVHAAYILTNIFSERMVMISILLMRVFPNDAPVSEKVLKMLTRITTECMPSELLHKEYSTASVAHDAWLLLQQRDTQLYEFLQNTCRIEPADDGKSPIPQSLLCLKGWLECGFLGWVPEYTAVFLWDQLVLEGARPETFQELLPFLCFCMLECMRESLLANPKEVSIIDCIRRSGRELKSKQCIQVLKRVLI